MHLNSEQLVDLADGAQPEFSAPHLAACEPCRAQLRELRAMMSVANDAVVPEPSPLFWDHLSSRVRDAVAVEASPHRVWFDVSAWRRLLMPVVAVAVAGLVLALIVNSRNTTPTPGGAPVSAIAVADASPVIELLNDVAADDDASLTLVASLTDDADLDTVREAGLAPAGSAEHAVTHMSGAELRELGRMLKEEMARSGA
jgi:hypothetical protein